MYFMIMAHGEMNIKKNKKHIWQNVKEKYQDRLCKYCHLSTIRPIPMIMNSHKFVFKNMMAIRLLVTCVEEQIVVYTFRVQKSKSKLEGCLNAGYESSRFLRNIRH